MFAALAFLCFFIDLIGVKSPTDHSLFWVVAGLALLALHLATNWVPWSGRK